MDFSYTTTTSESDWQQWATRNIDISDGGISLSRTTSVRSAEIDTEIQDIATDAAGMLYLLSTSGALSQYDPNTESRRMLLHANTSSLTDPRAICASETQVYVADGDAIATISLQRRRETGQLQPAVSTPHALGYDRGTIFALDESAGIAAVSDQPAVEWELADVLDLAITESAVYALAVQDDERVVLRRERTEQQSNETAETVIAADGVQCEGTPFQPTAIATAEESLFVAGTTEAGDEYAVFEWRDDAFTKLVELPGTCHELVGRVGRDGLRSFYALCGEECSCRALTEVRENVRHPEEDKHVGLAVSQLDSGVRGIVWHRLALEMARSSVNTQVRVWYQATDEEALLHPDDVTSTAPDGGAQMATPEDSSDLFERLFSPDARRAQQSIGLDSLRELLTTEAGELADRSERIGATDVRSWQETGFDALETHIQSEWTLVSDTETQDILFRNARGRYLNVAIELLGTSTASPLVDSVTAYCPRQSYLRHMPELYQQDQESAAFLEQFLSVFETSFTDIQSEIETMTQYFDPAGTPSESLAWLEGWLAADEYQDWPESASREYLSRAPELYKRRGTRTGLRDVIELYLRHATDGSPESTTAEREESVDTPGPTDSSADTPTSHRLFFLDRSDLDEIEGGADEAVFESLLPTDRSLVVFCGPFEATEHHEAIEQIVETETPAHVDATVLTLEEEFFLGSDSFLGLNSTLGTQSFSLGDATLGKDSYLSTSD